MALQKMLAAAAALVSSQDALYQAGERYPSPNITCPRAVFLDQWVDHSNYSAGTFRQQVQVFADFYKPGGPIVLYQGAESIRMLCIEELSVYEFSRELGGIAVSIEHRYFGSSTLLDRDASFTPEGLRYLTLDNVMDDTVKVIKHIQKNVIGAADSRVITVGGSYGAQVATALRLNRPEAIYGAVASAGPLITYLDEGDDVPGRFDWWNWISRVISERSAAAAAAISSAFKALDLAIESGQVDLKSKLNLCRQPIGSADFDNLLNLLMTPFQMMVQFNQNRPSPNSHFMRNPLNALIDTVLENTEDSWSLLKAVAELWHSDSAASTTCFDIEGPDLLNPGQGIQGYPFMYIFCTYMPTCLASVSRETIFSYRDPPPSAMFSFCKRTYGVKPMTTMQLADRYKLSQEHYEQAERILFVAGQYDPTTVLGPAPLPLSADVEKAKHLYVSNMAHCEDISAAYEDERSDVKQARQIELETIKGWLQG